MLSREEIKRYSKQLLLSEIGIRGQEKLKLSRVTIVGAGGLGCPVLQYLAAAGVGTIGIIDYDLVDESNLQRQVLYLTEDIGKAKAIVAAERISKQNPLIQVVPFNAKIESGNAIEIISDFDIIADCSDNFETRYLINDACVLLNKPFVYGGIYKFEGQLSVFNFKAEDGVYGPTYRCIFSNDNTEDISLDCSNTGVIGTLPGIIGTMQANEIIKIIVGLKEVCSGKLLLFNALTNTLVPLSVTRNEAAWNNFPKSITEFKNKNYFFPIAETIV